MTAARLVGIAAVLFCVGACSSDDGPTGAQSNEPALALNSVAYGTDPAQVMDVVLPAGRGSLTPVVIFIHGGGWSGGDKSIFSAADLKYFSDRGFACFNINYRLASNALNVHDPLLSNDVTSAINFVEAHASEYKVAVNRVALVGHSAGAHLALLAGYKYNTQGWIKAVASLSGPTDLTDPNFLAIPTVRSLLENYLGVTQTAAPARWTDASPLFVATGSSPPTIIVHGQMDILVPYGQAGALNTKLGTIGVAHEYHLFSTFNHDLGYTLINHFPNEVWDPVITWFRTYVAIAPE